MVGVTLNGKDTVSVLTYQNKLTIFSRSVTKASRLYWAQEVNGNWSNWVLIGGSSVSLQTDVAIAYNGFSKVFKTLGSLSEDILGLSFCVKLASCLLHNSKDTKHWEIGSIKIY